MDDLISRAAAIEVLAEMQGRCTTKEALIQNSKIWQQIKDLPAARPDPLTDKEQRIFLAAMAREEKICEEVDRNYVREPYEDSLMGVCKEIRRKVKDALWT